MACQKVEFGFMPSIYALGLMTSFPLHEYSFHLIMIISDIMPKGGFGFFLCVLLASFISPCCCSILLALATAPSPTRIGLTRVLRKEVFFGFLAGIFP